MVYWNWLKKSFHVLEDSIDSLSHSNIKGVKRQLDLIILSVDRELMINSGESQSLSNNFWKFVGHPLVPASADDCVSIQTLRQHDISTSPLNHDKFSYINFASGIRNVMTLGDLIHGHHPCLSITNDIKLEVLSALCMSHWTTTDEMSSSIRKEKKNYDVSKVTSLLSSKMNAKKDEMSRQLHLHALDATVHFDTQKLDLDDLEKLKDGCSGSFEGNGIDLVQKLLSTFADLQLMQAVEFWCVKEEKWIIETLASVMISGNADTIQQIRRIILPCIKVYVDVVINQTVWPVSDLRALQSIVWAIESTHASMTSFHHLFRCTYSTLLVISTRHHWCNSFKDLHCINDALISPSYWNFGPAQQKKLSVESEFFGYDMGSTRLQHNVISASLFRLLGLNKNTISSSQKHPYLTLENFEARQMQSKRMTQFLCKDLSVLDDQKLSSYNMILFFIENIINALHNSFDENSDVQRLRLNILSQGKYFSDCDREYMK